MKVKNYSYVAFILKTIPLFLMMFFVNIGWGQTTVVHTFDSAAKLSGAVDSNISISTIANTASAPAYNAGSNGVGGHVRLYSIRATGDGNEIILTPSNGATITSVSIVRASSTGTPSSVTYAVNGGSRLNFPDAITGISATSSFSIKNQHLGGTANLQLHVSSITVIYNITPTNAAPTVSNVAISGLPNTTVGLTGTYDFSDAESNPDTSTFKWYTATDASGTNATAIAGATATTYTLTNAELAKYIRFGVTPASSVGTSPGVEVFSTWIGPVNAAGSPVLNVGTLADFDPTCINVASSANSFTLSGNNLQSAVSVGALTGYSFSQSENGTYTSSLTITPTNEEISTTIFVKFTPSVVQSYNGTITVSGGGATAVTVSVVGSGINTPTNVTTTSSYGILANSATAEGNFTEGCSAIIEYGIEYSTTNNFADATGTKVTSSNSNAGNFTASISGLLSNTAYYYKAYVTTALETVYGIQNNFTTALVASPIANAATLVGSTTFNANWNAALGATSYEIDVYMKTPGNVATNLIISEYGEGNGGNKKYIEIFNATGTSVDLSNYRLWFISNGGDWPESELSLSGTLLNNATYVIANNDTDVLGADLYSTSLSFNGDDAIGLAWNEGTGTTYSLIDSVGNDGVDPGAGWPVAGVNNATVDKILIRKSTVLSPTTNWVTSAGTNADDSQWIVSSFAYNATSQTTDLGSHTFNTGITNFYGIQNQNVGNVTSYMITGLFPEMEYFYVVRAKDANSTSLNSNEILVTTLALNDITTYINGAWTNGIPTADLDAIIDANFTTTADLTAKSLTINQGKVFTVASGHTLTVVNAITNNSVVAGLDTFVVENDAFLIQTSNATNTGMVTVKRNSSSLFRQDYTLWSSPVSGQNLRNFSPATLFNRFSTYDTASGTNGDYQQELFTINDVNTKVFGEAKGYLIRMPNNWIENINSNLAQPYLGKFNGTLNNGDITIGLSLANTKFNLVGNPYASPISISAFFTANPNIEKTLYFWRKTNGANASSGYATCNELGTVTSAQTDTNGLNLFNTIKPGQGFFVKSNTATALSFNNGMRTNTGGTFFFKGNASSDNVHRFWLNLSMDNQVVGQTLIGYAPEATQGIDNGLDALYFNDSATALTSLVNANEYIIQGRALPFEASDVVVLGFKSNTAGTFTISLADFDGLFTGNQDIFLKDKAMNTVHNLKNTAYTFTTPVGVFNERFEVQYESALGTSNPSLIGNTLYVSVKNQQIKINAGALQMEKIEIVDVSGRIIYTQKGVQASTAIIDQITASNQMLIVRITTKENGTSSHKIVF